MRFQSTVGVEALAQATNAGSKCLYSEFTCVNTVQKFDVAWFRPAPLVHYRQTFCSDGVLARIRRRESGAGWAPLLAEDRWCTSARRTCTSTALSLEQPSNEKHHNITAQVVTFSGIERNEIPDVGPWKTSVVHAVAFADLSFKLGVPLQRQGPT